METQRRALLGSSYAAAAALLPMARPPRPATLAHQPRRGDARDASRRMSFPEGAYPRSDLGGFTLNHVAAGERTRLALSAADTHTT